MKKLRLTLAALILAGLLSPIGIQAQQGNNAPPPDCTIQRIPIVIHICPGVTFTIFALIPSCHPHH